MSRGCGTALSVVADRGSADRGLNQGGVISEQRLPHPRGKFDGAVGRMHADALEHIDQVGVGIDLVQPARHQQTLDDADALRTDLARSEQPILL